MHRSARVLAGRFPHDRRSARSPRTIEQLGLVEIVRAAADRDVVDGGRPADTVRIDVVELEEAALRAAVAAVDDEGASTSVALPGGTAHLGRDVPRVAGRPATRSGPRRSRELLLRKLLDQHGQGTIENSGEIAIRDLMAQEVLREPQLVAGGPARRELHLETIGRESRYGGHFRRLDPGAICWARFFAAAISRGDPCSTGVVRRVGLRRCRGIAPA